MIDIAGALAWTNTLLWVPFVVIGILAAVMGFTLADGEVSKEDEPNFKRKLKAIVTADAVLLAVILVVYAIAIWLGVAQGAANLY